MKLWGYYAFHTFINSIKKMFRSTFIIIMASVIVISAVVGGSIGFLIAALEDEAEVENPMDREGYGDPEYGMFDENGEFLFYDDLYEEGLGGYDEDGNFIYYEDAIKEGLGYYDEHGEFVFYFEEMTEEDIAYVLLALEAGIAAFIILLIIFGVKSGMKSGSDIFTMADVNFLFTSPLRPQSVLMFRLSFQMLGTIAGSIYLLFQIPNLVLNVGVPLSACLIIFAGLIVVLMVQKLVSVGMYTYTATHEKIKKWVTPVLIGIAALLVAVVGLVFLSTGMDVWKTLELTLASKWSRLIPFVGWMKGLIIHAIHGNIGMVLLYAVLTGAGMAAFIYVIWHMKADFYEDAMSGAQAREDILVAAAENRKVVEVKADGTEKKDKRKVKETDLSVFGKSCGASVFLAKERLVRTRLAKFGFITNTMIWYFTICVGISLLMAKVLEVENPDFTIIGVVLMLVMFFRNYGNPIAQETSMNYLFMVPESPYKKVFFAMMAGTYAAAMDLLPGVILAVLIMGLNPIQVVLWFVVLLTMDFMLSGVGMMLEALFPATAMDMVKASIQMILKFMMIMVIVIVFTVGLLVGGIEMALVFNLIMNVILGGVSFIIYPSMLHDGIS